MTAATRSREAGVTLIETLVVLAILGTAVGAAMLALPQRNSAPTAAREAQLLQARLTRAVEASLGALAPLRMRWDARGYSFEQWDETDWQALAVPILSARHEFTGGVTLEGEGELRITPELLPPEGGPLRLTLQGGGAAVLRFDGYAATLETGT
ncbi:prepilin-type N-terminal cleavage/methylation domain-containing protein [Marinovum sp.]|uniref:prepilin-type N-terminal cleavage/methylation domain-containing protein n=1 Tax=Marinovum sp. TaxID=2024839 RepID=UPI002B26759C|nr:prepilin-type N-terminal cleavage/methylation domain-containing protein [Marinovum sp.]